MENIYLARFKGYYKLTKPNTVWLLFFVGLAAAFIASGRSFRLTWENAAAFLALLLAIAGTNAVTCWIDRDIDSIMERTQKRPLPRGEISPRAALLFGLSTFALGCALSLVFVGRPTLWLVMGFLFSAILYNWHLKRRHLLNILFASPAGMMPILYAWEIETGSLSWVALAIGGLVVLWTPAHIWSLAIMHARDYGKAGVPMLPVVLGERTAIRLIALFNALLIATSIALGLSHFFGTVYLVGEAVANAALLVMTVLTLFKPTRENAWRLFKFTSPYLAVLFILMVVDRLA